MSQLTLDVTRRAGKQKREIPVVTGRSHTGRRIASPTPVGMFSFSRISISDSIDVHSIRIMSGSAHITGRLGARMIGRGGHGGRALSRGTVGEHLEG